MFDISVVAVVDRVVGPQPNSDSGHVSQLCRFAWTRNEDNDYNIEIKNPM